MFKKTKESNKRLTKEEKKEIKRKRKEEKIKYKQRKKNKKKNNSNKDVFHILGTKYGDRDARTKEGIRTLHVRRLGYFLLILGIVLFVLKFSEMLDYKTNNSTPIGTQLTFSKSEAILKISDIWTDKNREVTIVKLKYSNNARKLLSMDGENYNLHFVHRTRHKPKIKMKYGILGTEGDGYLFIKGKLDRRAYQIFMANALDVVYNEDKKSDTDIKSFQNKAIEETISNASEDSMDENGILQSTVGKMFNKKRETPRYDNMNFRINAYSDNTKVYQGSFLKEDGSIDYAKVVGRTSLDATIKKIEKLIKDKESDRDSFNVSLDEYKRRLERDKKNESAKESIKNIKTEIEKLDETIASLNKELNRYKDATFSKSDFGNMQEEFNYVDIQKRGN